MKIVIVFMLLALTLIASSERKIIVGSYTTEKRAVQALKTFQTKLDAPFFAAQQRLGFRVVARPSGDQYIIALEPFPSYKEAKKVKKMLPKKYASAFINKYTPPAVLPLAIARETAQQQSQEAVVADQQDVNSSNMTEASAQEALVEKKASRVMPLRSESNMTESNEANVTIEPVVGEEVREPSKSKEASFIIDAVTMKLIDAKKAYYAIEGQTYGIMSPSGKFAFAEKEVAEEFIKQYGGRVVDYATMKELEQTEPKQ